MNDIVDCSQTGSSVHGILQTRILEWEIPSPGDLCNSGIKPASPALEADSLLAEPPEKPNHSIHHCYYDFEQLFLKLRVRKQKILFYLHSFSKTLHLDRSEFLTCITLFFGKCFLYFLKGRSSVERFPLFFFFFNVV